MTLIFSCLTRNYVLQVSDRRLTVLQSGGLLKVAEDDRNKAIIFNRTFIFAYTGWATIGPERDTSLWFADILKHFADADDLHAGMLEVARLATIFFAKQSRFRPEDKLHTFVGVGWKRRRRDRVIVPAAVRITNAFDDRGQPLTGARPNFVVQTTLLNHRNGASVLANGVPIEQGQLVRLGRWFRRAYYRSSPRSTAKVLVKELRRVADRLGSDGLVGKNVMVTCLPKAAALSWSMPLIGAPDGQSLSTYYVPLKADRQIVRSALVVQKGFPVSFEIEFSVPLPPDGSDPFSEWR